MCPVSRLFREAYGAGLQQTRGELYYLQELCLVGIVGIIKQR